MPHELLVFITWKTWGNVFPLDDAIARHLEPALHRLAAVEQATIIELAVLPTHVHLVAEVTALTDVPRLVQRLKGASARFANRDGWSSRGKILKWEAGYDVRSVARVALPQIRAYLDRQSDKHGIPILVRWSRERAAA